MDRHYLVPVFLVRYLNYELPCPLGQGLNWEDEKPHNFATPAALRNCGGYWQAHFFPG